ncbi:MAG: serine/threonine-protein kinase [Polyangiaceae bacterium]
MATTLDQPGRAAPTGYGWSGAVVEDEDDLVGRTLNGTYVIERVLGEGGMGRVYLARHTRIERKRFAIKVLHPELVRRPDIVRRFRREAEAAASIRSEHVMGVFDVDTDAEGRPYIVSELLDGVELGDLLSERGRLEVGEAVAIIRDVCRGLSAAHAGGVVHRDMKPENVFLTGDPDAPVAKVLDFGISRLDDGDDGTQLTKAGTVMGTPAYMPPEQARGEIVDHRADIYSVGAMLYRALTGKLPFERDDPMATVAAVLTTEPERPRTIAPQIPEALEVVIQRAMAKDRDARFQSMAELGEALAPFATTGRATAPTVMVTTGGDRTELLLLLVGGFLASALAVVAAGASVVWLVRGSGPSGVELAVVLGALGAGLTTPIALVARQLKVTIWNDSARVQRLVQSLRRSLGAGVLAYGVVSLGAAFIAQVGDGHGFAAAPLLALVAATLAGVLARVWPGGRPTQALLVLLGLMSGSLVVASMGGGPRAPTAGSSADGAADAASAGSATPAVGATASPEAIASAKADGLAGIEALREQYPTDPAATRLWVIALAADPKTHEQAMDAAGTLHGLDPEALLDPLIEQAIVEVAKGPEPARQKAIDLMAQKMGTRGPDLLWDLARGPSNAKKHAAAALAAPEMRARMSPALAVLLDLEQARGCGDKAKLLERVTKEGDRRAAEHLEPFTRGSRSGCGFLKMSACPPACAEAAAAMRKAIEAAKSREP